MGNKTIIKKYTDSFSEEAKKIFLTGGLVAFPTETVYGLGANALDEEACKRIYEAKGRPQDNPLIVHIGDLRQLDILTKNISEKAKLLIDKFWPGPLTIVLNKSDIVPKAVTAGLDTVAIRMPSNEIASKLLKEIDIPIAAPSANLSGKPSPTTATHVLDDFNGIIEMVIDGGSVEIGLESTIVDASSDDIQILRPGHITKEMIEELVGPIKKIVKCGENEPPKAPGMKYKHYAPKGELYLIDANMYDFCNYIDMEMTKGLNCPVCILTTDAHIDILKDRFLGTNVLSYGDGNIDEASKRLYKLLRSCDDLDVGVIFSIVFSERGKGNALMNRLKKAAVVDVIRLRDNDEAK